MTVSKTDSDERTLLERADVLAKEAKRGSRARGYNHNAAGNMATLGDSLVEEIEALRLTMLALFGPLAQTVDIGLALLALRKESDRV